MSEKEPLSGKVKISLLPYWTVTATYTSHMNAHTYTPAPTRPQGRSVSDRPRLSVAPATHLWTHHPDRSHCHTAPHVHTCSHTPTFPKGQMHVDAQAHLCGTYPTPLDSPQTLCRPSWAQGTGVGIIAGQLPAITPQATLSPGTNGKQSPINLSLH